MASYVNAGNLNPINQGEMKGGEYVLSDDLNRMMESTHALLNYKSNILAYSYCHAALNNGSVWEMQLDPADELTLPMYVFTIRRPIPDKIIKMHVWCEQMDLDLEMQDAVTNAWSSVGTVSVTTAARGVITVTTNDDSDQDGSDHLHRMRFRLMATANGGLGILGKVFGFVMFEANLTHSAVTTTVTGTTTKSIVPLDGTEIQNFIHMDTTASADNSPFDVLKWKILMRNIETLARAMPRGCAVVFPRHYRYPLSSVFHRADGPFQWKSAPWASSVSVIVDADSDGESDWNGASMGVGAFSGALKEELRSDAALREIVFNTGGVLQSNSMAFANNVIEINDVKVRAGEWNDIFLAFRGQFLEASHSFNDERTCAWVDFNEGVVSLRFKAASEDPDPDYVTAYIHPAGHHLIFRSIDANSFTVTVDPGDGSHVKPDAGGVTNVPALAYSTLPGDDELSDTYTAWDLASTKGADGDRHVYIGVSPCPPFRLPGNQDQTFHAQICKHGFTYLNSLWINDHYEQSSAAQYATHLLPPSASLNFAHLKLLNNMLDHPWQVNGIRNVAAGRANEFNAAEIVLGIQQTKNSHGCNYFIFRNLQERYKDITNHIFSDVAEFPLTVPTDTDAVVGEEPRRVYDKVKFRVHYRIFKMNDGNDGTSDTQTNQETGEQDNQAAKVRLFFRGAVVDCPGESLTAAGWESDPVEVDIRDKPQSRLTVETFTEWDAMAASSKLGQAEYSGPVSAHFMSTNQHAWPAEIIGEKYPWDVAEVEVDLAGLFASEEPLATVPSGNLGIVPEYFFPTWIRLQAFFYSYLQDGSGAREGTMQGGDKYHMVIASVSLVPSNYPLEELPA